MSDSRHTFQVLGCDYVCIFIFISRNGLGVVLADLILTFLLASLPSTHIRLHPSLSVCGLCKSIRFLDAAG